MNLIDNDPLKPVHVKAPSAVTTKEQSNTSHYPSKTKSYLSTSNKVSERKEEEEVSSGKGAPKPALKFENANIMDLVDHFDEIIEEESESIKKPDIQSSSPWLLICFMVICTTNILVNVDHGCIPAATVTIKRDLHLDNASLGVLGSVVF